MNLEKAKKNVVKKINMMSTLWSAEAKKDIIPFVLTSFLADLSPFREPLSVEPLSSLSFGSLVINEDPNLHFTSCSLRSLCSKAFDCVEWNVSSSKSERLASLKNAAI